MSREDNIKIVDLELSADGATLWSTTSAKLLRAMGTQPVPPCVDRGDGHPCEYYRRCASELLACRSFYAYTRYPDDKQEYARWESMERHPTAKLYAKTYKQTK